MKKKIVKNKSIHIFVLLMLCFTIISSLCACSSTHAEKSVIRVFADQTLETYLPLIGEKFLVTNCKDCDLQYVFDDPELLQTRIESGGACDILITASDPAIRDLVTSGKIFKEESLPIVQSHMALVVPEDNEAISSLQDIFIRIDPETEEEPEGYQRYIDILWNMYGEEWQEEWDANDGNLWVRSDFFAIAICSPEKEDGVFAKTILNRENEMFELLDRANFIRLYSSSSDVINAVQDHQVTAGICNLTDLKPEQSVKMIEFYDRPDDPARIYQICRLTESEHKTEAKQFLDFLQGDHARRFFEDFGFECLR